MTALPEQITFETLHPAWPAKTSFAPLTRRAKEHFQKKGLQAKTGMCHALPH